MREISFVEYVKHFFIDLSVVNNEILNSIEIGLSDVLTLVFGIVFIAASFWFLVSNFFIKDEEVDCSKNQKGSLLNIIGGFLILFIVGMFPIYGVMKDRVLEYNELTKSISDEKYVYLAYTKDFLINNDFSEALEYLRKKTDFSTMKFYIELNNKKESPNVKELVNLINLASEDEIVNRFEFNKIQKNLNELKETYMSTNKEIEKVKTNLGINIK